MPLNSVDLGRVVEEWRDLTSPESDADKVAEQHAHACACVYVVNAMPYAAAMCDFCNRAKKSCFVLFFFCTRNCSCVTITEVLAVFLIYLVNYVPQPTAKPADCFR